MLEGSSILFEFQRLIENHAENIVDDLTKPMIKDTNADTVKDLEGQIHDIIAFYSNPSNWNFFAANYQLSKNIVAPTNEAVADLSDNAFKDFINELLKFCENTSEVKRWVIDCTGNLQNVQQATLERIIQKRFDWTNRHISFGRLRSWTNDMMKSRCRISSDIKPEVAYAVAAKCARLRRRLSRLFCLARASHLLNARLAALDHPQIATLQQNLMRIRLQLILHLKQNSNFETPVLPLFDNPEQLAIRFESLASGLSAGVTHDKVHSRLDNLAENITDLLLALSQETSGLFKVLAIAEPLNRDIVSQVVRRSLDGFCNFYVTSFASELGSDKADALLAQLTHSEEETEDLSLSDTEAMMDAFDVFDSFNERNPSPIASDVEEAREDLQTGNEVSAPEPISKNPGDFQATEEVNFTRKNYFEMPLPLVSTRTTFEGPSTPKETPPLSTDEDMEVDEEEQNVDVEREEGEIFDDENAHHDLDSLNECCDIDETEEAIMREWAPMKENQSIAKSTFTESVQKAVNDAVKSCYRELLAIATLGASDWESAVSKTAESQLPCAIVNGIKSAMSESQSSSRRSHFTYSRSVMLRIREFIFASLLRQRQSKQLYRKFFETK